MHHFNPLRRYVAGLTLAASVALAAHAEPVVDVSAITSIRVLPDKLVLAGSEQEHRLLVTGRTDDGREVDLTDVARYSIGDSTIARVGPQGIVRAVEFGTSSVTIVVGRHEARIAVTVGDRPVDAPVSFRNDVMPVLSRAGCNSGGCHGKQGGQNGFQLSVFGFDPRSDHTAIVKGGRGRRIFLSAVAESLLLRKPTARVKHGGGQRLETGTPNYRTLLRWLEQGAEYTPPEEPTLVEVTVLPAHRSYAFADQQPLLVQARYSDGSVRDVTGLTHFRSNDDEIAEVDEHGRITVQNVAGEAVVIARYVDQVVLSRVTVPLPERISAERYAGLPRNNFIDGHVYAKLQTLGLLPSERCTDGEFIRRASLDAIGVLPTPEETRAFLADGDPDKRNKLIDRVLDRRAYADHWATKWGDLIRANPVRIGTKSVFMLDQWLRASFRRNTPYDQFVRDVLTAEGSTHRNGPTNLFRDRRTPAEITTLVSQIFLGVRFECARCHHHPNEKWSQDDFYQLAAYFGEVKRKGRGISPPISEGEEFIYHAPGGTVTHPVSGAVMLPKPPDGAVAAIPAGYDPRAALVDWMVQPGNPFFARAIVNRIWAEFFGRGVVEPVDDFRASNPPTNAPLLDALAADFIAHRFDLKHLMRTIMRSHVYQLSSLPNETNVRDTRRYARAYRRRLPAEVLADAVSDVTGVPARYQGMAPGTRAIATWNHRLRSYFMDAFGRPNASADCPCDRDTQTSVVQALHLMNSEDLQKQIAHKTGRATRLADTDRPTAAIIEELYLAAFSRFPTADEVKVASAAYDAPEATRQTATEDIIWALLNSAEFVFNH